MNDSATIQVKKNKKASYPASYLLCAVLLSVFLISAMSTIKDINRIRECVEDEFRNKGESLVNVSAVIYGEIATNSAVETLQETETNIVQNDYDIAYALFMDTNRLPVVIMSKQKSDESIVKNIPFKDSISIWASKLDSIGSKKYTKNKEEVIEFAKPVINKNGKIGFVRYGISTHAMKRTIRELVINRILSAILITLIFLFCGLVVLMIFRSKVKKHTSGITEQIKRLIIDTEIIAKGNFSEEIRAEGENDIVNLAANMDKMRSAIKVYTDNLQKIIDNKSQQINDILNSIDQGLFSIDLEGRVYPEYSKRTNEILKVEDISRHSIQELFRSDQKQEQAFATWLSLVKANYNRQRWKKLVRLCPVHEIELQESGSTLKSYVSFDYQKILDEDNNLCKILILARDNTAEHQRESELQEQKRKSDNEVKNIIAIANAQPEELTAFVTDIQARLFKVRDAVQLLLDGVERMRAEYPYGESFDISDEQLQKLYTEIRFISYRAEAFGFEAVTTIINQYIRRLDELHPPVETRRDTIIRSMMGNIDQLFGILNDIRKKINLCHGEDELHSRKIPIQQIESINNKLLSIDTSKVGSDVKEIIEECKKLSWKQVEYITDKFKKIAQESACRLNKEITVEIEPRHLLLPPDEFDSIDTIIIDLITNAVEHGIELPVNRQEKGIGHIKLSYQKSDTQRIIKISDDGAGIDIDMICKKALETGIISEQELGKMGEQEKIMMICNPAFHASRLISEKGYKVSGMSNVKKAIEDLNGSLHIENNPGSGTTFIIKLPNAG